MECDLLTASPDQVVDYVTVEGRRGGGRRRRSRRKRRRGRERREGGRGRGRGGIRVVHSQTDAEDSMLSVNQYCCHVTTLTTPT